MPFEGKIDYFSISPKLGQTEILKGVNFCWDFLLNEQATDITGKKLHSSPYLPETLLNETSKEKIDHLIESIPTSVNECTQ